MACPDLPGDHPDQEPATRLSFDTASAGGAFRVRLQAFDDGGVLLSDAAYPLAPSTACETTTA